MPIIGSLCEPLGLHLVRIDNHLCCLADHRIIGAMPGLRE